MAVIRNFMKSRGYGTNVMLPQTFEQVWMWRHQENWCCMCKYGSNQSPLMLETDLTIENQETRIGWAFRKVSPVAIYNGHEIELLGGFGEITHALGNNGRIDYQITKITFKFPAEHFINEIQYDAEMLLHMKSKNVSPSLSQEQKAILSFMIQSTMDSPSNQFVESLRPLTWEFAKDKIVNIDGKAYLEELIAGGMTSNYKKSFYSYIGSTSTPPCSQNIQRIVMQELFSFELVQSKFQYSNLCNSRNSLMMRTKNLLEMLGRLLFNH